MNARILALALLTLATLAYIFGPSTSLEYNVTTSPQGLSVYGEAYTVPAPTEAEPVAASCTTDLDCVMRFPHIIPDANTIDEYLQVYGDIPHFPTTGDCSRVDWLAQDGDGEWFVPIYLNNDGAINCNSDLELGA